MTLWNATLAEFREQIGSSSPTPGGGSVACVCAVFGVGLLVMSLEITRRAAGDTSLDGILAEARELSRRLVTHADRDVAVFQTYMAALALPRASDVEKRARATALADAALAAAEAPLAAAGDMLAALALAERAAHLVKPNVASDVLGGADLLGGSIAAALRNVDINRPSLGSDELRDRVGRAREDLARAAMESLDRLALRMNTTTR
jgi:formiminotetrahydrofolate cyclodeaminase